MKTFNLIVRQTTDAQIEIEESFFEKNIWQAQHKASKYLTYFCCGPEIGKIETLLLLASFACE